MKTTTLLLAAALLFTGAPRAAGPDARSGFAQAPIPTAPEASLSEDPCERASSLPEDPSCGGQPLCSRRERVQLACEVRDALEKRYVFYPVKGRILAESGSAGFDPRRHLTACVAEESAVQREDDPLRFYDRMRGCVAAFQDGHLILSAPVRLPQVALGIGLRLAEGKVRVANREKKLLSFLRTASGLRDLEEILALGNEVLEIDGRPATERLRELGRYLPASSEAARRERAVDALTRRDFDFPTRRTASLTVSVNGARRTVELPWWISPDAESHVMSRSYVRRTGIATTELLAWRYDQGKDTWDRDAGSATGYLRTDTILAPQDAAGLREYRDEQEHPAVRVGEVVRRRDRAFCYLQILTFHTETLVSRDGRQPFTDVLAGFVKSCKEKSLDLVLDLRQNGGGYLSHTSALFALLGERERTYPGGALLLRANTLNQLVYQQRSPIGGVPARADDAFEPRYIAEAIGNARRARQDFTPAFLEQPLRASDAVGGYAGRVVALVAPTCMSACDRLAALLRNSGRGLLVGGPTEGAGGSQQEARNLAARWADPEGLLSLSIPNAAMGVQRRLPAAGERRKSEPAEEFFQGLTFENRPVPPDVAYSTRLEDITGQNRGWLEQVDAALFGGAAGGTVAHAPIGSTVSSAVAPSRASAAAR